MNVFWGLAILALTAVALWKAWHDGPRQAVGWVTALSLLVPVWVAREVLGQPINVRIAGGIAGLTVYLFHRRSTFRTRLVLIDFAMMAIVAAHLMSDWWNEGFSAGVVFRIYGEWAVAYLAGRVAIQSLDDVRDLMPVVVVVICLLSTAAVVEAGCRVNLFEAVVGRRPLDQTPWDAARWGMKRAYGPAMHSIFFGTLQLLLLPWSLYAAWRAIRRRGPAWWRIVPAVSALGILATASRAPLLALGVALYVGATLYFERLRKPLVFGAAAALLFVALFHDTAIEMLHQWDRWGQEQGRPVMVMVDGQEKECNSTLTRIRLLEVYRPAMARAGALGFGTTATTGFPINVPVGPQHVETLKRVRFIDNTYVLMLLRFGCLGLFCFTALGIAVVGTYAWLSLRAETRGKVFLAGFAGTIAGYLLLIATVWNSHDFGFWYLWSAGAGAGLLAHRRRSLPARRESRIDPVVQHRPSGRRSVREARCRRNGQPLVAEQPENQTPHRPFAPAGKVERPRRRRRHPSSRESGDGAATEKPGLLEKLGFRKSARCR